MHINRNNTQHNIYDFCVLTDDKRLATRRGFNNRQGLRSVQMRPTLRPAQPPPQCTPEAMWLERFHGAVYGHRDDFF
jgi:hypothetical protein